MRALDPTPLGPGCVHQPITHDPDVLGLGQPVKDLAGDTRPCDRCADARCPVGGYPRLAAFRIRAAQLVARFGYEVDVEVNQGSHGIDLICRVDGVAWVWEFSTDDPAAVAQAVDNRDHILAHLRAEGVRAEPGPAFPEAEFGQGYLHGHEYIVGVRSHPAEPGVELLDVYACVPCHLADRWHYPELVLHNRRLEDLLMTQMHHWHGGDEPPNRVREPSEYHSSHLYLSLDGPGTHLDLLRLWFTLVPDLVDPDRRRQLAAEPEPPGTQGAPGAPPDRGEPGTAAAVVTWEADDLDRLRWRRLTSGSYADLLSHVGASDYAQLWFGQHNPYGWAMPGRGENHHVYGYSRRHNESTLVLAAVFNDAMLADRAFGQRLLEVARRIVEAADPGYAEIGYEQWVPEAGLDDMTKLDRVLYRHPVDSIAAQRSLLRGYSWLTVVPGELADRLGGAAATRATGAFHQVETLPQGGLWLLATEHFDEYDPVAARRVFEALAPVLPPGRPARTMSEPHLIILEDARVGRSGATGR
ncbi:hypothetical protein [Catellatospora tritici]|uniref:hypothetical protein n=1 Tax=Catellatospora tritici TaxID=2851566 RepID=UPI001C2CD8E1|nr:hypothetical protein [Catellatospora tritici]MBV1855921.1 hypothetical protein [Catellatospora tritici]